MFHSRGLIEVPSVYVTVSTCEAIYVHTCGPAPKAEVRYSCTRPAGHAGPHEHRPRPDRMAIAEWS